MAFPFRHSSILGSGHLLNLFLPLISHYLPANNLCSPKCFIFIYHHISNVASLKMMIQEGKQCYFIPVFKIVKYSMQKHREVAQRCWTISTITEHCLLMLMVNIVLGNHLSSDFLFHAALYYLSSNHIFHKKTCF